MRLTFEQIEALWDDMINGFIDIEESESNKIKCIKVVPNDDLESLYYLDENGDKV